MKYAASGKTIALPERKELNGLCLKAIQDRSRALSREEIFNSYTGVGGLHGLEYKDFGNYRDFSEAKKEIEQGQFFTSDALCAWVTECLQPEKTDVIADLTFGKGSLFNHMPVEGNLYGCEIDPNSYTVARHLFPKANLCLEDIRSYRPDKRFDLIVGNPPYNISWPYRGKRYNSQALYILKAAELLRPTGLLAVIVPETFLGDMTPKREKKEIFQRFNHVVQVSLDPNAFAYLGVRNFPTKLLILQKQTATLPAVPYSPELVAEKEGLKVYMEYVLPAKKKAEAVRAKVELEMNRSEDKRVALKRKFELYLYQIKSHPATRPHYTECYRLVCRYLTQKCPEDMTYVQWEKKRLRSANVLKELRQVLCNQNKQEVDKVELVKGKNLIYYRAYSQRMEPKAEELNRAMPMQRITQLVPFGTEDDLARCGKYRKLIERKQTEYRRQTQPFSEMEEDPVIGKWLEDWELNGVKNDFTVSKIKLNAMQRHDVNLILQKRHGYMHWGQGSGKTVAGTAVGMYHLEHGHVDYVFVVSSAISIETTWAPFFKVHGIRHRVITKAADLRRVYQGDFVLITLGRVRNNQRAIQRIIRIGNRRVLLIYDEAHNSSALEQSDQCGALTKATLACFRRLPYKLLMSGTAINNNVVEAYPQLYLLYNASCNMLSMADIVYTYSEDDGSYSEEFNDLYGQPYPPYIAGRNLFRASHLPVKPTVFGVVKTTPDILNASVMRDVIQYTMITRTFEEVTGKKLKRLGELPAVMTPEEEALYAIALKEFFRLEHLYFKSTNMSDRKKAQSRIIAQIKLMLRVCVCAPLFPQYTGDGMTGKLQVICSKLEELAGERVVIGVRHNDVVKEYARQIQAVFPDRPVFTITGSEYGPEERSGLIDGDFSVYPNSILVCTQQSLSESISIDIVDNCIIAEMHWNDSRMAQFYCRFIRYISTRVKNVWYCTYPGSIESNLLYLVVSKERMLRYLQGQDISFLDLFAEMGLDFATHQNVVIKSYDKEGRPELQWGKQMIAA